MCQTVLNQWIMQKLNVIILEFRTFFELKTMTSKRPSYARHPRHLSYVIFLLSYSSVNMHSAPLPLMVSIFVVHDSRNWQDTQMETQRISVRVTSVVATICVNVICSAMSSLKATITFNVTETDTHFPRPAVPLKI